ncbi:Ubiquitin domain-containing protein UBFD1 [Nymphon striatum]|nr:Ubiquitin domain-containing protein UBFD1 [Nymphon striatum]
MLKEGYTIVLPPCESGCNIFWVMPKSWNYEIKRKICKKCNSLLLPGITASVRYKGKNKRIIVTCKNCKQVKRFCTSKDYTLWYDQQEIENRQVDTEQEDNSPSNNKIAAITLSKENNLINSNSIVSANSVTTDCSESETNIKAEKCDVNNSSSDQAAEVEPSEAGEEVEPSEAGEEVEPSEPGEEVEFKVIFNKKKYDVKFPINSVPASMQKLMFKGLAKDDKTLKDLGVIKGAKLMVVGSTLTDILAVSTTPTIEKLKEEVSTAPSKELLCKQKSHKKIIDKGLPEDVMPGLINKKDSLPHFPISGMVNKTGGKVRLTFKLELDQLWLGTKERTEKLPMNSIKNVISEPIEGYTQYHILGLQLGSTEASRYWIYWVPAQYVDAIKDAILGKWQIF